LSIFSGFFRIVFVLAGLALVLIFLNNEWQLARGSVDSLADPSLQLDVLKRLLSNPIAWILFLIAFLTFFIGERLDR
jgi:hypothetical protein